MKYNITINQKAVIDNGLMSKLDIIDLAIFDFVYHFFNSDFEDKVTFTKNGVEYTEIRPSLLEREMPLLKIGTKRTFINRMNNLINVGLIERYENNSNENRSGYKKGVNFSIFEFDKPAKRNSQGYENDFTPPMKTDSHNNNINDNSISNNNKEEIDKSISKKEDIDFGSIFSAWNEVANDVDEISSIRELTDKRKKQIRTLFKSCNSTCEEFVRFIKTIPYADDWVIGKGDRKWSIDFDWLIQNTSNWYVAGLEGNMHKKNRYEFDKIMRGEEVFKQSKKLDGFQYL